MSPILVALPPSPWSEKASWALDHHGITYRAVEHVPMVYEPLLRLASREPRKKPTVPMLFDGRQVFRDSLAIARHAEAVGRGEPLIPREHEGAILTWNEHAERLMTSGRARLMERLLASPAALIDELPTFLRPFGSALLPVARIGAEFIAGKFDTRAASAAEAEASMSQVMELAAAATSRGDYLVAGRFSLADLAIACALGFVEPHARTPHGPAARLVWREPALAAAFPSLLAWRDRIVERHR